MAANEIDNSVVRGHYRDRILTTAKSMRDIGVLVAAGSVHRTQQTYVAGAIRDTSGRGAHVSAGGIYVVFRPGNPGFSILRRREYTPDSLGYITAPLFDSAISEGARHELRSDLIKTNIVPYGVNLADLAAEGISGIQRIFGEKGALEKGISLIKMQASLSLPIGVMTMIATDRTVEMARDSIAKMEDRLEDLASSEKQATQLRDFRRAESFQMRIAAMEVRMDEFSHARDILHDQGAKMVWTEQELYENERIAHAARAAESANAYVSATGSSS